jgi:ketosteroid isomerase-like protein
VITWERQSDDERAIRDLVDRWMAATRAGDVGSVLSLMSDDAILMARRAGHTLTILRKTADGRWLLTRDANLVTDVSVLKQ